MSDGQFLPSLLVYLLTAGVMTTAGVGLLASWPGLSWRQRLFAAPPATLAFWSLVLGMSATMAVRVSVVVAPLWAVTVVLSLRGLGELRRNRSLLTGRPCWALVACLAVPAVTLLPYFVFGLDDYPGSRFPDGWSYASYGQYLWTFPRGTGGDLGPVYEFAFHLANTRHVGSSLLGLLSCLTSPGDTQRAAGLLLAVVLFSFASACLLVAEVRALAHEHRILFVLCTVGSGWVLNAVDLTNYDNLVALSAWPAMTALVWVSPLASSAVWIGLGAWLAAMIYAYPEFGMVMGSAWALSAAWQVWQVRAPGTVSRALLGAATTLVLLGPNIPTMMRFFVSQASAGLSSGVRPGAGGFLALLIPRHVLNGLWGLGGEHQYLRLFWPRTFVAILLTSLLLAGLVRWARRREYGLLAAAVIPLGGGLIFLFVQAYPYGAFKMILSGWWVVLLASTEAVPSFALHRRRLLASACALVLLAIPVIAGGRSMLPLVREGQLTTMRDFRVAEHVASLVGDKPIGVFVEDAEAEHWATYFLRDVKMRLGTTRGYFDLDHVRRSVESDALPWSAVQYLLTDAWDPGPVVEGGGWTLAWQSRRYRLWATDPQGWAVVTRSSTPNGFEQGGGRQTFWMGGGATTFTVVTPQAGCLVWSARIFPGPRVSGPTRRLEVTYAGETPRIVIVTPPELQLQVPVRAGTSTVSFLPMDAANVPSATADQRELILGVADLSVGLRANPSKVVAVENPNGMEALNGQPFFWLGRDAAVVDVSAREPASVVLTGVAMLGPSVSGKPVRRLRITAGGASYETTLGNGAFALPVHVPAGTSRVWFEALDESNVPTLSNGDRRTLLLGIHDLQVSSPQDCATP
ncbi:hypothetical protein LuPra_04988 [Luteitalea pratensis]|uniref:Uncharacterized protein n=1 Tax=Luteitalea pratensis TaxID=1855912 RepID=A0A143PUI0_LUTPR|nr:hypothetical protein [Luteitalea pratensis]AMY11730.1 hypothetical protein LuPra_04988 [Luteitalea pratensis]